MSLISAIGPNMLECHKKHIPITGLNFRPMPSMQYPPWVPLAQSWIYRVSKTRSRKADRSIKPGNDIVYVQCIRVAINWTKKVEQAWRDNLVGFPKSSHIYLWMLSLYTCTYYISTYVATQHYMHLSIQILLHINVCMFVPYICNGIIHLQKHCTCFNTVLTSFPVSDCKHSCSFSFIQASSSSACLQNSCTFNDSCIASGV